MINPLFFDSKAVSQLKFTSFPLRMALKNLSETGKTHPPRGITSLKQLAGVLNTNKTSLAVTLKHFIGSDEVRSVFVSKESSFISSTPGLSPLSRYKITLTGNGSSPSAQLVHPVIS